MAMKKAALAAALGLLLAGAAHAGEAGIINQSGPYEATMTFYPHPAHGFSGSADTTGATGPVSENANGAQSGKTSRQSAKTVAVRSRHEQAKTHVSAELHFDP